jgi:uncharacterized protein (TIGR03067 family)
MRTSPVVVAGMIAISLLGSATAQTPEQRLQREEEKLAGVWQVTGAEANGQKIPARQVPNLRLTFKSGKYSVQLGDEKPQEGTYKIDPSKMPRTIDINRTTGPDKGKKQVGIYELVANTLKICACETGNERPTDFDTSEKPGYTVLILKRVPPPR